MGSGGRAIGRCGESRRRVRGFFVLVLALAALPGLGATVVAQPATPGATPAATPVTGELAWWQDAVCYEVFVRSFFDSDGDGIGDLPGLTAKLDYLNDGDPVTTDDLGVTCLWLMPVAESPSYHGYDVVDYYAIEPDYGTLDDFKTLIAEANRRGVRVIVDLVLNHVSVEHPWFAALTEDPNGPTRDYFVWSEMDPGFLGSFGQDVWHTPPGRGQTGPFFYGTFGDHMPDLNYANPAVTEEAYRIARFWIEELGVDGFRLDAIKHLIEDGQVQENTPATHQWLRDFRAYIDTFAPDAYLVGEIFGAGTDTLLPYFPDQLTSYFHFEIGTQILTAADFGLGSILVKTIAAANDQLPDQRWAPFLTNHDQVRVMTELGGDIPNMMVAATALLTGPGLPFLYYGEEIGMTGEKPDPRLRTPMQWTADAAGFTSGSPWEPFQDDLTTVNVAAQEEDPASLLNHYRHLIQLHAASPALAHGTFVPLEAPASAAAFLRVAPEQTVLVVINFSDDPESGINLTAAASSLPPGEYNLTPLLGDQPGTSLVVAADGSFAGYAPLPTMAPLTGYVFELRLAGS